MELHEFSDWVMHCGLLPFLPLTCKHMSWDGAFHWGETILPQEYVSPLQIQLSLYTYLSAEFIGTASIYNATRRVGTVLQLMHMLKYYYWVINPADSSGITPEGLGESLLTSWMWFGVWVCVCVCFFKILSSVRGHSRKWECTSHYVSWTCYQSL